MTRRLPERFTLVLHGTISDVRSRAIVDNGSGLKHVLHEILLGSEFPEDVLKPYGITIYVEDDMDQGPE